jgi:hypothetical protein
MASHPLRAEPQSKEFCSFLTAYFYLQERQQQVAAENCIIRRLPLSRLSVCVLYKDSVRTAL